MKKIFITDEIPSLRCGMTGCRLKKQGEEEGRRRAAAPLPPLAPLTSS